MELNQIIRIRREELGLTMKELADRVGVSEGTISRWEGGQIQNMKRDKIARLSEALEVPPSVLMNWEEYDAERIEKNKLAKKLCDLATVSDARNVEIALDLLKKLEGKG
ncbi:MAG: helix-turn-helix domain-containing protein [Firmicutes bacterium]|nr:helix-turn-helix domain-containing protein [Bacillota bacterium]MBR3212101.1 helix-turn-helix domain-containing protein [Bacillota bacterium]